MNESAGAGGTPLLRLGEAVLLCHALVNQVAVDAGVRVLFIKGPVSVSQGLRPSKISADVDVFVEPGANLTLSLAMGQRGWKPRPAEPDISAFPRHAETMFHPDWPCDVDIHFMFPGMEAEPTACFNAMWRSLDRVHVAGHGVPVPNRQLAICILALHALRTPWLRQSQTELEFLSSLNLSNDREKLEHIAEETGALAALSPFFVRLGWNSPGDYPPISDDWRKRTLSRSPGSARILSLLDTPAAEWPAVVFRAAFPSRQTLLAKNMYADLSLAGRWRLYASRWAALARSLPGLVEDLSSAMRRNENRNKG